MAFTKFSKYHQEETSETKIAFTAAKLPGGGPRIPIVLPCWIWLWKRTREEYLRQRSREAEKERRVAWVACLHIRMILSSSRIGIALWTHFSCFSFRHNSLYDPVLQLQDAYVFLLFGLSPWRSCTTLIWRCCVWSVVSVQLISECFEMRILLEERLAAFRDRRVMPVVLSKHDSEKGSQEWCFLSFS